LPKNEKEKRNAKKGALRKTNKKRLLEEEEAKYFFKFYTFFLISKRMKQKFLVEEEFFVSFLGLYFVFCKKTTPSERIHYHAHIKTDTRETSRLTSSLFRRDLLPCRSLR